VTTQATSPTGTTRSLGTVGRVVDAHVSDLQRRFLSTEYRDPDAVAALARLRRGAGKPPGAVLDILEFTTDESFWVGREDAPADAAATARHEYAAHVAMTLYATHQQSRGERMHRRGRGIGQALRALHTGDPARIPDPLTQRFRMLGTADSPDELTHHLRGAVQLLRAGSVPLDYGLLADQLVDWRRGRRDRVQLAWGRGFYRTPKTNAATDIATN
jgi:CRISPR system Cascade subunit CasB